MKDIFYKVDKVLPFRQRLRYILYPQTALSLVCGYENHALRAKTKTFYYSAHLWQFRPACQIFTAFMPKEKFFQTSFFS
jgi:hypothetical protein